MGSEMCIRDRDKLIEALENEENEVLLSEQEISDAHAPLLRMLELAK